MMYKVKDHYKFRNKPYRELWIYGDDGDRMYYCTDGYREQNSKLKYKHRTGCKQIKYGQYFVAKFPDGGRKNIYLSDLTEYR